MKVGDTVWLEYMRDGKPAIQETKIVWKGNGLFKVRGSVRTFHKDGAVKYDKIFWTSRGNPKIYFTNPSA